MEEFWIGAGLGCAFIGYGVMKLLVVMAYHMAQKYDIELRWW